MKVSKTELDKVITNYRERPISFIKNTIPDLWDNLYQYQKEYISLLFKIRNSKEQFVTLIPKQRVCINCGKKFKDRNYYYKPCRGSSKSITDTARFTRIMCCSDECFNEYWNEFWRER